MAATRCSVVVGQVFDLPFSGLNEFFHGLQGLSRTLRVTALFAGVAIAGVIALPIRAQSKLPETPRFEVASVRPAAAGAGSASLVFKVDAARVDIRCMRFAELIEDAFGMPGNRIANLASTTGLRFDIAAKLPPGASEDQIPEMLQALLADRFKLSIHRETKELQGYGLVVARGGLNVPPASMEPDAPAAAADPDRPPPLSGRVNLNGVQLSWTIIPNPTGVGFTEVLSSPRMGTVRDSFSLVQTEPGNVWRLPT
jgi:hypothetical protein